ncbi:WhiB family transcriptional regulator [Streptomyces sp. SID8352]|uniref:WhiB family transcriptional regulator n=1 Tax=Streptomyces sp. SID8352 TaxID=2690338 RepID=UPI00192630E2
MAQPDGGGGVIAGWWARAACAGTDPDAFYADGPDSHNQRTLAQQVCAACPVRAECAAHAIQTGENWGMWGGMTQKELRRRRLRGVVPTGRRTAA